MAVFSELCVPFLKIISRIPVVIAPTDRQKVGTFVIGWLSIGVMDVNLPPLHRFSHDSSFSSRRFLGDAGRLTVLLAYGLIVFQPTREDRLTAVQLRMKGVRAQPVRKD